MITGAFRPSGRLPLSLPAGEAVIAVDENGRCVSPNDVPGFAKDDHLPEGMSYAYLGRRRQPLPTSLATA